MQRLPHLLPVRFVREIIETKEFHATCELAFETPPTLPMLIEAAAQCSVFVKIKEIKRQLGLPIEGEINGMLTKVSKSALLAKPSGTVFTGTSRYKSNFENFFSLEFEILEQTRPVAKGELAIILLPLQESETR